MLEEAVDELVGGEGAELELASSGRAFGDQQNGRLEIEAAYERLLHQTMPGAVVKQERGIVRILTPELAVWQGGMEIIPAGSGAVLKGFVVQVMKKVENSWLILEAHPKLFPPAKPG